MVLSPTHIGTEHFKVHSHNFSVQKCVFLVVPSPITSLSSFNYVLGNTFLSRNIGNNETSS
jgi:hypothetical protein